MNPWSIAAATKGHAVNSIQWAGVIILACASFVTLSDLVNWMSTRFLQRGRSA